MQLRVVTDQPWDVKADVLVIPVVGEPAFDGPLGELDRRAGGELSTLAAFRELTGKRFATTLAASGDLLAGRILTVGAGDPATLDREAVVRVGASAERRLGGRVVRSLAIWLTPLGEAEGLDGDVELAAQLVARGVVEGSYDPKSIYRSAPPGATRMSSSSRGGEEMSLQSPWSGDVSSAAGGAVR